MVLMCIARPRARNDPMVHHDTGTREKIARPRVRHHRYGDHFLCAWTEEPRLTS